MKMKNTIARIRHRAETFLWKVKGYPFVRNVNRADERALAKRALLVYLVKPFLVKDGDPVFLWHQNLKQCKQIAAILGEFGYAVDAADSRDGRFRPGRKYDLIISHRLQLSYGERLPDPEAKKIYLATGMNHKVHNQNILRRYRNLFQRRGCKLTVRQMNDDRMPFLSSADALVGFGNDFTINSWRDVFPGPRYSLNNYGFQGTIVHSNPKEFSNARKNFLFFASGSQVGKGLDLLLEIFPKHPDLHLHVCSHYEKERDFRRCYHRELFRQPNIHPVGFVGINSRKFSDVARKCAFLIYPSCAEGQSGAVVQGMHSGLIPLATREAGIDMEDFGILLPGDSLEEIEKTALAAARMPVEECRRRSARTRDVALVKYGEAQFAKRWRQIIADILKTEPA